MIYGKLWYEIETSGGVVIASAEALQITFGFSCLEPYKHWSAQHRAGKGPWSVRSERS